MEQQVIYVEGHGFIPIQSGETPQQAIANAQQRRSVVGIQNPMGDQRVGVELPPMAQGDAEGLLNAVPQLAGLAAQFTPVGKSGMASMAVPGLLEAVIEMVRDGKIDPMAIAGQVAMGRFGKGVGDAVEGFGTMGKEKVLRSLALQGDNLNPNTAAIMPDVAIREGAEMSPAGIRAVKDKADRTGSGILEELGDILESAHTREITSPPRMTLWPQEAAANWLRRGPRQLAMGQGMARARGMGPSAEAITRALMTLQQGGVFSEEPPMETSRGPRRRAQ